MERNERYRDFGNRTSFNGRPCSPDQELVPVVLSNEMRRVLMKKSFNEANAESWTIGKTEVPVAFIPIDKGNKKEYFKEIFNRDVKRFITDNVDDLSGLASLDEILDKVNDDDESAWDPTGTTHYDDLQLGLSVIKMLIDDVAAKNPDMGKIIRLLADGYQKKEILEKVKLGKGKTQGYAFIEKAQSLAKEIYLNNYC